MPGDQAEARQGRIFQVCLAVLRASSACTYTPRLEVPPLTGGAPLSGIATTPFVVKPLDSMAPPLILIGFSNEFMFPVELARPSGAIVGDALCSELRRTGHMCTERSDDDAAIRISGVVTEFKVQGVRSPWQPSVYEHVDVVFSTQFPRETPPTMVRRYRILGKHRTPPLSVSGIKPYGDYAARMLESAVQQVILEFTTDPEWIAAVRTVAEQRSRNDVLVP